MHGQAIYLGAQETASLVGSDVAFQAGRRGNVIREQAQVYGTAPGAGWHVRREDWERIHPDGDWFERERQRARWEQMNPGIPFVGAEVVFDAISKYGLPPRAALIPAPAPTSADRQVLPMNTGTTPVPIGLTAQITSRPQRVAFRPERVFVSAADVGGSGSSANWIINDITIGNRSQFAQSGALPGDMFGQQAIDTYVTFETAQTAMDVVMIVTYQGATEGGTPFYGSIVGTAAV